MSAERTFSTTSSMPELSQRAADLCDLLCRQLEEKNLKIKSVTLKLKYDSHSLLVLNVGFEAGRYSIVRPCADYA